MAALLTSSLPAATLIVDLSGGGDYTDVQSALDAAADGDTVLVKPGDYLISEPIQFNRLHQPGDPLSPPFKDLIVRSEGGEDATMISISPLPSDPATQPVVLFDKGEGPASGLEGFTLAGGIAGVYCTQGSGPSLKRLRISGNATGVECTAGSAPSLDDCTIQGNRGNGVRLAVGSSPTLSGCTISQNQLCGLFLTGGSCDGLHHRGERCGGGRGRRHVL
jgi:parallel beta-helix repeat protein